MYSQMHAPRSSQVGGAEVELTLKQLEECAGDSKVMTPEKLQPLINPGGGEATVEQREAFARALAPILEMNIDNTLVKSAAYAFLCLELDAHADSFGLSMKESLRCSTNAEHLRRALNELHGQLS